MILISRWPILRSVKLAIKYCTSLPPFRFLRMWTYRVISRIASDSSDNNIFEIQSPVTDTNLIYLLYYIICYNLFLFGGNGDD